MKEQTWPEVHERCSRRADEKYQEDERYCRLRAYPNRPILLYVI